MRIMEDVREVVRRLIEKLDSLRKRMEKNEDIDLQTLMTTLLELNAMIEESKESLDRIRDAIAQEIKKRIEECKEQIKEDLGFEILMVSVPKGLSWWDKRVYVHYCYKEFKGGFEEVNERFAEVLEKRFGVPKEVTKKVVIVGSIARPWCPYKDICQDMLCD